MQRKLYPKKYKQSNNDCPTCGFHVSHTHSFEMMLAGQFDNSRDGGYTAFRSTPTRASTIESDVLVPLAQSLVWSIVSVLPAIPISAWLRYEWYFPFTVGAISLLISWLSAQKKTEASLSVVEEFSYSPNENKGQLVSVSKNTNPLRLEVVHETSGIRSRMQMMEISGGVDEGKFGSFLKDIMAGKSTARKNWTPIAKCFSKDDYEEIIEKLLDAEVLERGKSNTTSITQNGKRTIRGMVKGGII